MSFTRRKFLECCARGGMGVATMLTALKYAGIENAYAQTCAAPGSDYKALVCIFLEGGNDGWNTVVPFETNAYNNYAAQRTAIALPRSSLIPISPQGHGANSFALHSGLPDLANVFGQGKLAVVNNVGNLLRPVTPAQVLANPTLGPSGLFDHAQQQVWSQSLISADTQGWGNSIGSRFMGCNIGPVIPSVMSVVNKTPWLKGDAPSIALDPNVQLGINGLPSTGALPARFQGVIDVTGVPEDHIQVNALNARVSQAIADARQLGSIFTGTPPFTQTFPDTTIGRQMRQIAIAIGRRNQLGHARRQVFYAQVQGNAYDFHGALLTTQARLLRELNDAMFSFYNATIELGVQNSVTTFTHSEFGRTIKINGDGSDHGWGGSSLVMGGSVLGGRFYGVAPGATSVTNFHPPVEVGNAAFDFPLFSVSGNFRGAYIPTISVDQLAFTLARWFGLPDGDATQIFPNLVNFNAGLRNLGFLPNP